MTPCRRCAARPPSQDTPGGTEDTRSRRWLRAALLTVLLLPPLLWGGLGLLQPPPLLEGVSFAREVLDRQGRLLRMGLTPDGKRRIHVPLEAVAPAAVHALLLYEDQYFFRHPGVNPLSLLRAAAAWLGGGRRTGASTITMQVARLRMGLASGSWHSKIIQIWTALLMERHYSKRQILEAYFNLAPYGGNIEGIEAAARVYFHKSAFQLTVQEALALTVIPQNPVRRHPLHGPRFASARALLAARWIMAGTGEEEEPAAGETPPPLRIFSPSDLPFEAPHVAAELLAAPGADSIVHSTISLPEQHLLERMLARFAARGAAYGLHNAAALLVHAPSREIRALAGSASFHNAGIAGQVDGSRARRSPGSTLKPFVYALALDQGLIHPMTLLADSPRSFGGYDPENFDRGFRGPLPAHEALKASRNLPAITLAQRLRDPGLYAFLKSAGVALPHDEEHYGLSLVLGGAEVSMRELTGLYAMLWNQGLHRPLRLTSGTGEHEAPARLLSPEAACITLTMLEHAQERVRSGNRNIPLRFKTGTSNGFRDAWTAGLLGEYVLVVWVGNFDNSANPLLVGGETALPLFTDMARALGRLLPLHDTLAERLSRLNVRSIPVCTATGDTDTSLCPDVTDTLFIPGVSPVRNSRIFQEILVDKASGLRACRPEPGRTERRVMEFWPSDLARIFAQAGIRKPAPPEWMPQCRPDNADSAGPPPRIRIPKAGVTYHLQLSAPHRSRIPLTASAAPDATVIFWFAGDTLLGSSPPDAPLLWTPRPGSTELRAVDNLGRTARRTLRVRAAR